MNRSIRPYRRARTTTSMCNAAAICLVVSVVLATVGTAAQRTTELYIPIGRSPGVSGTYSVLGEIISYDESSGTLTIRDEGGEEHAATITDATDIWLDRSSAGERNTVGTPAALEPGRRCEIKHAYARQERLDHAEWVKVVPAG